MKREYGPDHIERDPQSVVTVGTFDGVHRGHQAIIRYLCERAKAAGGVATVVSFDPHPREVVMGERVPLLTTLDERAELLEAFGVERFVVLPFTRDLSMLEAEEYVREILVDTIGLCEIVIGYDHAFGRNRSGNRETLENLGPELGFTVDVIPEQVIAETTVSSSRIRKLLGDEGDAAQAALLLGRPYRLTGTVIRGDGRGHAIGFPTANLRMSDDRKLVPRTGVYAVRTLLDEEGLPGMMNIGNRPTFGDGELHVEVHLFDTQRDLYGRDLTIEFVDRIRDERRFDGVEALVEQLTADEAQARRVLGATA